MKRVAFAVLAAVACTNPQPVSIAQPTIVSAGPVLTRVASDAQATIDTWAEAIGGRDAVAAVGVLHAKGTYERGGVIGTIELWQTPRGERREELKLGFLHEVRVFDGTQGWLVDRNREVRELAGFELDDQLSLSFRDVLAPIVVDRRAGAVTRDGDKLVFAAEGSKRPETVTFDRGTQLPETLVRRDGEKLRTTRLSDWNVAAGVKRPFTIREDNGNPNDAVTIHWKSFDSAKPASTAFIRPLDRESEAMLATQPVTVPIEVVYGGLIFVKVLINDQPMSFIFDTGAEATILNSSRLGKLGLHGFGTFATGAGGGDVALSYVQGVTTKVGDAMVTNQIVAAVFLDQLEVPLQRPLDGILGYDFISRFVVELDYVNQTMRLYDRAKYHHTGSGKAIPFTLEDSTPWITAAIEVPKKGDVSGRFVLDTGCLCDVNIHTPFVDQHELLKAFPHAKLSGYSAGAGGVTQEMSGTIPALKLGGVVIKDPKADFSRDKHGASADPEYAGLVGSLTWKRFVLVLDYKNKQAWLDPLK